MQMSSTEQATDIYEASDQNSYEPNLAASHDLISLIPTKFEQILQNQTIHPASTCSSSVASTIASAVNDESNYHDHLFLAIADFTNFQNFLIRICRFLPVVYCCSNF